MSLLIYRRTPMTDSMLGHVGDLLVIGGSTLFGAGRLEQLGVPSVLVTLGVLAVLTGYPVVMVRLLGGTPGQRLVGVRIVCWEGAPISWRSSLLRLSGQFLELALLACTGPIGLILLMVNRSRQQRWWHDSLAGTRLIKAGEPDPGPPAPLTPTDRTRKRLAVRVSFAAFGAVALLLGLGAGASYLWGAGKLHLVAPDDAELRVRVDESPEVVLAPGTWAAFEVRRGRHQLLLFSRGRETRRQFEASGGSWGAVAQAEPEQCFVLLDVTRSNYGSPLSDGSFPLPDVKERLGEALTEVAWASEAVFGAHDLPPTTQYSVRLVSPVGCEALGQSDEGLLRGVLGYEGRSWKEINADPPAP